MAYSFNQRVPEFFKVYLPEDSFESLLIPDAFVVFCNRLMPKNAVLSNHMGSLWHVIVDYIDGRVFFLNGWKKFVGDNSIDSGDLLIFRYSGQCGFSVKVFGQDACEKIENNANGTSYMNKVKLEDDEEEKQKEEEIKENDNDDKDCDDHDGDDNDDSDYLDYIAEQEEDDSNMNKVMLEMDEVEKEKDEETKENDNEDEDCDGHDSDDSDYEDYIGEQEEDSYMNKVKLENDEVQKEKDEETKENANDDEDCDDHDSNDSDYEDYIGEQEEEDSTNEEEAIKNSRGGKRSVGNIGGSKKIASVKVEPGFKRSNPINIEEKEESFIGKSRARKQSCGSNGVFKQMHVHNIRRGYKRTNDVLLEEVDARKIILPQNPHFIAKLKTGSNRNLLLVPAKVLKLSQLKLQNLIFFRNKCGMHWPGDVINRRNNQIYIRGWNDFCMANHVSMNDSCICEFPQSNNQEVNVIDVHIVCNTGEGASRKQLALNKNG
ncbi:hypothetical protein Dsin_022647 [Dipteronia sinensis]|uniref:TF-B3 domain-containing protein n=1 Tax=Dipteronia sinensis TaxID=43782 RepID=A0AAE0A2S7_9ROSI|nr:hypothetical protein Dsin_022647 [Dipteronia sinensis]